MSFVIRTLQKTLPWLAAPVMASGVAHAEEGHAHDNQPLGMIDPLITHHARLENEVRLNYSGTRAEDALTHLGTLEVGYVFTDWLGVEVVVPAGLKTTPMVEGGIGDIELDFPRWSFLRRRSFVMTAHLATIAPTGDEDLGLGDGRWLFAPHLLTDLAVENFGLQSNVAIEVDEDGAVAAELNVVVAYAVALDHHGDVVIAPLIEANFEAELYSQDEQPLLFPAITPGLTLLVADWRLGAGVQIPVGANREFDLRTIVQLGYHVPWQHLFAGESD